MTGWEDIHKIVSCVLTIPFVELCPDRRHPLLLSLQHIFQRVVQEVIVPLHSSLSKIK